MAASAGSAYCMASTEANPLQALNPHQAPWLLSTAYLPNIDYFRILLSGRPVLIEAQEHYLKQSFRNRCVIYSANGPLTLSIPVMHGPDDELITGTRISYAETWQNRHWRAITSAYKNSPYFDYFADELRLDPRDAANPGAPGGVCERRFGLGDFAELPVQLLQAGIGEARADLAGVF